MPDLAAGGGELIEEILPAVAVAAEAFDDVEADPLLPEEEEIVGRAVEKRRREFATGRSCARRALARLGAPTEAVGSGARGEPLWPTGVVGSITHCDDYRASVVGRSTELRGVGIDAEPNAPLKEGLLDAIARPEEKPRLAELSRAASEVCWDRLLFSAKESVYKTWFPLTERWLGFEDATLTIDPAGTFAAELLVRGPIVEGTEVQGFEGRWLARDGLLVTAIALTS